MEYEESFNSNPLILLKTKGIVYDKLQAQLSLSCLLCGSFATTQKIHTLYPMYHFFYFEISRKISNPFLLYRQY